MSTAARAKGTLSPKILRSRLPSRVANVLVLLRANSLIIFRPLCPTSLEQLSVPIPPTHSSRGWTAVEGHSAPTTAVQRKTRKTQPGSESPGATSLVTASNAFGPLLAPQLTTCTALLVRWLIWLTILFISSGCLFRGAVIAMARAIAALVVRNLKGALPPLRRSRAATHRVTVLWPTSRRLPQRTGCASPPKHLPWKVLLINRSTCRPLPTSGASCLVATISLFRSSRQ